MMHQSGSYRLGTNLQEENWLAQSAAVRGWAMLTQQRRRAGLEV